MMQKLTQPVRNSHSVDSVLLALNAARLDERKNAAAFFSSRLEVIACYITKRALTGIEAAEALRLEAERIQNETREMN
ncbi:MAG: DUF2732 family protein [Rouxiella aceris]|uniref:DUF2732 family protein n=1 Tax=Rouxiella aceris TaxID=2703884 RepID=UPI00283FB6F3|nr:DUF2732 family protein [Rouxiella aceris]MDR3432078.1 DUF2732 family protein [Rouxiella aceris]